MLTCQSRAHARIPEEVRHHSHRELAKPRVQHLQERFHRLSRHLWQIVRAEERPIEEGILETFLCPPGSRPVDGARNRESSDGQSAEDDAGQIERGGERRSQELTPHGRLGCYDCRLQICPRGHPEVSSDREPAYGRRISRVLRRQVTAAGSLPDDRPPDKGVAQVLPLQVNAVEAEEITDKDAATDQAKQREEGALTFRGSNRSRQSTDLSQRISERTYLPTRYRPLGR